ncbi:GNAT family N-acetyltransferase [Rhodobacter sp. HX-7-19]|uniref:GNAT family N-acetyltransferase n=1 Tax=Paragemmobacter kunshanensis TaxID=2583234 RepID=A0A6M1TPI1_9RHOB|nr:GNAT family protein [Rhodobacter kunshanensis]NGQ92069.1 GNAT family N-acetyltransferase [Rhodobacter kunshanensis]
MSLRPALPADFAFIRALAQRPDYAPFITDEDEGRLAFYATDAAHRLLIWEEGGRSAGFALWAEIGDPSGRVELRRLGLAEVGGGRGLGFVRELTDYGFAVLGARKVWLDASGENLRAQKVYERAGYRLEGRLVDHWFRPSLGRNVDVMLYGILRSEWEALPPLAAPAP